MTQKQTNGIKQNVVSKDTLVIIDYINDIAHEKGGMAGFGIAAHVASRNAISNTASVLSQFRREGKRVIFARVEFDTTLSELTSAKAPVYKMMAASKTCIEKTWGTEFIKEISPLPGEVIVAKHRIDPFTANELAPLLHGKIFICGVATNFAVESLTRSLADRDYEVVVLEDCCASFSDEMHQWTIKNILPMFATVGNSEQLLHPKVKV